MAPTPRPNPVFSDEYRCLVDVVTGARHRAGLSQRALARALGRSQSHVCKIEQGERRIDTLEFYNLARACGFEPAALYSEAVGRLKQLEAGGGSGDPPPCDDRRAPDRARQPRA